METQLHERLLQLLSTMLIEINALRAQALSSSSTSVNAEMGTETSATGLQVLEQFTHEALMIVRTMLEEQPPNELDGLALTEALSRLLEESAERLGIASRIAFSGVNEQGQPQEHEQMLTPRAERLFLLLMREALYGIEQRPNVRRVRLAFSYGTTDVQFVLEDDGLNGTNSPMLFSESAENQTSNERSAALSIWQPSSELQVTTLEPGRQVQIQQPIIEDLRRRFEELGGTLVIRLLESRGVRIQASIPYTHYTTEMAPATRNTAQGRQSVFPESMAGTGAINNRPLAALPATSEMLRILIVDGQAVSRAGLRHLLTSYPGLQIVGEAVDGVQAVSETLELGPQVVLMDSLLPEGQSLEALRQIKQLNPDTHVLLLATRDREEYLYETLRAGADGYVLKDIAPDELVQAIRSVAQGNILIQPQIASRLISRYGRRNKGGERYETLTERELDVLHLLARGLRNKEIAARLYVSERTVNFHLANIYQKLNVGGRTEALSKALERGLITPP